MQHGSGHICAFNEFMITSRCSRDPKPERQEQCDEPHTQSKTHESTEQNTPENPVISLMTRGHPPWVAIEEAMHHAERLGYLVSWVNSRTFPCDFMAIHDGHITLVRVRRLRYARYGLPDITMSCKREILELQGIPVSENTSRELWVRGPDRHWHRYAICTDRIEAVEIPGRSPSRNLRQQTLPVG